LTMQAQPQRSQRRREVRKVSKDQYAELCDLCVTLGAFAVGGANSTLSN